MFNRSIKEQILHQLIQNLESELNQAIEASESTSAYTKADDMKQEGKYDTRAIEAGYLAGAQKRRVEEIKQEIGMLKALEVKKFRVDDEVSVGALVELELNTKVQKFFITPASGGSIINVQSNPVMIISTFSPIGDACLGLKVGDTFELETPKEIREYFIKSIN